MKSFTLFGVTIHQITLSEALEQARQLFYSAGQYFFFTPNPEFLVQAMRDDYFKEILNKGTVNVCDGVGLQLAARLHRVHLPRVTGVDLTLGLCALAEKENKKVFLLGSGKDAVVHGAEKKLKERFPTLVIAGTHRGWGIMENNEGKLVFNPEGNQMLVDIINAAAPDILFVAYGMGKQEKWLYENIAKLPSVKIGMGVGGTFDYLSGTVPRAPLLMRNLGLEWAYRLWKQPSRIGRIWNATAVFTYLVIRDLFV